jgi:small-conductance mechanosensitive channel
MESIEQLLWKFAPGAGTILGVILVLFVVRRIFDTRESRISGKRYRDQFIMLILTFAGILLIIVVLPLGDTLRGQLLSLGGLLLSAALALSATTFLGNAMAGVMHRAVPNFRIGDFVRVGEHFGRVTERGLLFTEIQTEDRDLTVLPNLYVVTNPVSVIRSSGTIVSANVSLGYDVPHCAVEQLLIAAAQEAELVEPFVQIRELADHAVSYRVAGLLTEVKQLISVRSRLHAAVLDALHRGGIEIVSPSFMNTRALLENTRFVPATSPAGAVCTKEANGSAPEEIVFDKAEKAESLERLREQHRELEAEIETVTASRGQSGDDAAEKEAEARLTRLRAEQERLMAIICRAEEQKESARAEG